MARPLPDWAERARNKWTYRGQERPPFAHNPNMGQESVWDYPRPPRLAKDGRRILVRAHGRVLADCHSSYRVLETASPPTFYVPPADVDMSLLVPKDHSSLCEWKGMAQYWSFTFGDILLESVAWSYPDPFPGYESIADYFSFYPLHLECCLDGERVHPQPGGLYGGWVTKEIVGPFKGGFGTEHW